MAGQFIATTGTVWGMDCAGCARKIEAALRDIEGVRDVSLHYPDPTLGVLHDDSVPMTEITSAVEGSGFRLDISRSA